MKVGSRRLSGQLEIMFGTQVADKTDWRKLLKGEAEPLDLLQVRAQLIEEFAPKIKVIRDEFSQNLEFNETVELLEDELPREFIYPVEQYPEKIKSHNLDKTPIIRGKLQGIKGQYLILDTGVINIRKYTGYELKIRAEWATNILSQRFHKHKKTSKFAGFFFDDKYDYLIFAWDFKYWV